MEAYKYFAKENYPMTAGCCAQQRYGLVDGHAYSLIDIRTIKDGGNDVTLVKMRNPWNSEKYTGPYSDNDSRMTAEVSEQLGGHKNKNDGSFWMPAGDWIKTFDTTSVAHYRDYKYKQETVPLKGRMTTITIDNPVEQHLHISGEIYSPRNYPRNCNKRTQVFL